MKEQNVLCARSTRYGSLDLWINPEGEYNIVATYDGESPDNYVWGIALNDLSSEKLIKEIDWIMGVIGRDTQNYFFKDIVIHWGVHTWKFINEKQVQVIEKDEYTKTMNDIERNYDIEW